MGAEQSAEVEDREASLEQLSHELALKFAEKCYTQLELYCFKSVFNNLADTQSDVKYWSEASLCRFLELPDALDAGPVIFQMATFLGAFPFPSQAPCIVTKEALLTVVTVMTQRYTRILKRGDRDRMRLFYSSLAVFDRRASEKLEQRPTISNGEETHGESEAVAGTIKSIAGFAIDEPSNDDAEEEEDDDTLAMAALDSLDAIEAISLGERPNMRQSIIPTDNFLKLVELLLLVGPLGQQEPLSKYASGLDKEGVRQFRDAASHMIASFGVEDSPGITYKDFRKTIPAIMPHIFNGLSPLFEYFLFQKDLDLSKRRRRSTASGHNRTASGTEPFPGMVSTHARLPSVSEAFPSMSPTSPTLSTSPVYPASPTSYTSPTSPKPFAIPEPVNLGPLIPADSEILNPAVLAQIASFLPQPSFYRLHHLYSGASHGFSLNSIESSVLAWSGASLLLVSGTVLAPDHDNPSSRERSFASTLPARRYAPGGPPESKVTYGAYIPMAWKHTHKEPLHNPATILFELGPVHDVFHASSIATAHFTFCNGAQDPVPGVGVGCPLPLRNAITGAPLADLGAISLFLDASLEYGTFNHSSAGGGSFYPSTSPARRRRGKGDWENRFEVSSVEVWGLGGDDEVKGRQRALEFEEREARLRREGRASISGGSGIEADRELLKMAGLIGQGESGGSMG